MKNLASIQILTALLFGLNATATTLTWNGTPGGNWNTTDAWLDVATPATWNSATPDSAIFGSTGAGAVNLTATTTAGGITFGTAGYTIAGNTLTLSNSTITANADAIITSALAGTTGLTKAGTGKLTLGSTPGYTAGSTTINAGTLQFPYSASYARATAINSPGALTLTSTVLIVGSNTLVFSGDGPLTIGGTANTRMILQGTGSTSYTGDITVKTASILEPRSFFSSTTGNNVTVDSGGELRIQFDPTSINGLNGAGVVQSVSGATTLTLGKANGSGLFTGTLKNNGSTLSLIKTGTGTQELGGANIGNPTLGGTTLTNGTLKLTQTTAWSSNVTMDNTNAVNLQLNAPNNSDSWSYAKQILGGSTAAKIEKTGDGTVTLNPAASSSFVGSATGALTVTGGKLYLNSAFTTAPAVSVATGTTFGGTATVGAVTVDNGGTLEGGSGGSGTLTAGNVTLGASGTDTLSLNGTLSITAGYKPLSVTNLAINSGDQSITLNASGTGLTTGTYYDLLVSANPITAPNAASVLASLKTNARAFTPFVDVTGTKIQLYYDANASVYWTGANGTAWNTTDTNWKLTGNNADTQFLVNDLVIFNDSPVNSTVDISTGNVSPSATVFNNATTAYTLQGSNGIATGSLAKNNAGTLTITNSNSYNGGTTISAGRVRAGNNAALGSGTITFTGGALSSDGATARSLSNAIVLGADTTLGHVTDNGDLTLGGAISGTGFGLIKVGAGTLTLSGTNSFTGGTSVNAGTLATTNWNTTTLGGGTNPAVSVGTGAALSISGVFGVTNNAAVTLAANSTLDLTSTGQGNAKLFKAIDVTGAATINLAHTGTTAGSRGNGFILKSSAPVNVTVNGFTAGDSFGGGWFIGGDYGFSVGTTETASLAAGSAVTFNGSATAGGVNLTLGWTDPGSTALKDADLIIGNAAGTAGVLVSLAGNAGRTCQVGSLAGGTAALTTIASDSFAATLQINQGTIGGADFAGVIKNGVGGTVAVIKNGGGTQIFSGSNTYSGTTTVSGGSLVIAGSISSSSLTTVTGGSLVVNGITGSGGVTVNAAGTLSGTGSVGGLTTVNGTLTPAGSALDQINVNNLIIGSTGKVVCQIGKAGSTLTSDLVYLNNDVTYGGTLEVTATGDALATGDSFQLFDAINYNGSFTTFTLPSLPPGLTWNTSSLTTDGTISVMTGTAFDNWASSKSLDGSNNGALDDPNQNGIANVLEYVLNGDPLLAESPTAILPTLDASGANFVFTFTRRVESAGDTTQIFEYGSALAGWTPLNITAPTDGAVTLGTPDGGTPNLQSVTVTVAKGANTKMFGRLKVSRP